MIYDLDLNEKIEGVPYCDVLSLSPNGVIDLHTCNGLTVEQLQLIVDHVKRLLDAKESK